MTDMPTTLIAVPTGGRIADLQRLLKAIDSEYGSREDVRLLVVDNTPDGSARIVFEEYCVNLKARARYVREPRRGYSNVRNAIIDNAGDVDAIAMIDDDEVPAPGWLDDLRAAQQRSGADVVAGRVVPEFPPGAPTSYAGSGVFGSDTPWFPEGGEMPWCASNNTLVLTGVMQRVTDGFDPRFNLSSGEDTHFFRRAQLAGCKIVWTHTAVVHEFLPPSRLTRRWVFRRATRVGNTRALVESELAGSRSTQITRAAKTLGLFGVGLGYTLAASVRRDKALGLRALHRLGLAYGMALAFQKSEPWTP